MNLKIEKDIYMHYLLNINSHRNVLWKDKNSSRENIHHMYGLCSPPQVVISNDKISGKFPGRNLAGSTLSPEA